MKEIWKDIEGYEGLYQVSNFGRIKSLDRFVDGKLGSTRFLKEKILKLHLVGGGYIGIDLRKDKKRKCGKLHRLVANAFIPNPENKPEVNHKNLIKINNQVKNLEWCTKSENMLHSFRIGNHSTVPGEKNGNSKLTEKQVLEIRQKYVLRKYSADKLAKEYNVGHNCIFPIIKRETWKHI